MEQQYKKYSQLIQGQFKKTSKKAQALFVGRAYQTLRACVEEKKDELKMRLTRCALLCRKCRWRTTRA